MPVTGTEMEEGDRKVSPLPELDTGRAPSLVVQGVLCALAALEGADNQLLGASLAYTGNDLGFKLNSLTQMSIAQGIFANAAAPFWGVLADRQLFRQKDLLVVAALGQGLITVILALQTSFGGTMIFLRGLNGLFLAGLRPIANGVIAKEASPDVQGQLFSRVLVFILAGGSLASFIVTPWAGIPYVAFGYAFNGWRPAWILVGMFSVLAALFTVIGMPGNAAQSTKEPILDLVFSELKLVFGFCCIPSFVCMVGQGVFGTIPWTVLWIGTRYYQASGLSDLEAGLISSWQPIISMPGTMLGGVLADAAAKRFGYHGRPMVAQATVALGIPVMYLLFKGIPPENGGFWLYISIISVFGIVAQWAQGGVNWPILATIVPADVRSRVLAVEGALENSLAVILGPIFLQYVANNILKFDISAIQPGGADYEAATALGTGLMMTVCTPWLAAYVVYSFLHISYPRDMKRMAAEAAAAAGVDLASEISRRKSGDMVAYLSSRGQSNRDLHI